MLKIVGGIYRGREITPPPYGDVRPTQEILRKAIFSALGEHLDGKRVLDVFAGSGAYGFESLSRGAVSACFIDKDNRALDAIKKTGMRFSCLDKMTVLDGDYKERMAYLGKKKQPFDVIFFDPPYALKVFDDVILLIEKNGLLAAKGIIVFEMDDEPQPVDGYSFRRYAFSYKRAGIYRKD